MDSYIKNCDCLDGMRKLPDNSIDLICTDPPYGMAFMGKKWDNAVPSIEIWRECLRILKPGAFAFVMSIPRQDCQAEMIKRLTDAGFIMSFTPIYWAYASGFPKASNISKMIDKRVGAEREVIKHRGGAMNNAENSTASSFVKGATGYKPEFNETAPATPQAKHFDGWFGGFQPKPAVEIILVCMKPLSEKTYVDQALANGKGCVNFDACRIPYEGEPPKGTGTCKSPTVKFASDETGKRKGNITSLQGRFPANLLVSDNVLDDGRVSKGSDAVRHNKKTNHKFYNETDGDKGVESYGFADSGQFSRFFSLDAWNIKELPLSAQKTFPFMVVEKASKGEKNEGCEDLPEKERRTMGKGLKGKSGNRAGENKLKNSHPTSKPVKLMSYLITLASRQGDIVLDPFLGSGTTAVAAKALFRKYIGFEREKEYYDICKARVEHDNFLF